MEEFNPEARDAQSAELERIRRLKLQQQMNAMQEGGGASSSQQPPNAGMPQGIPHHPMGGSGGMPAPAMRSGVSPEEYSHRTLRVSSSPEILQVEMVGQPSGNIETNFRSSGSKDVSGDAIIIDSGSSDSDSSYFSSSVGSQCYQGPSHPRGGGPRPLVARVPVSGGRGPRPSEGRQLLRKYDVMNYVRKDGRVLVNVGHTHTEPDVFLAPQIGRAVKGHQVRGVL